MKDFFTALAITSTLVITQACASQVKSGETPGSTTVSNVNSPASHNMSGSQAPKAKKNSHGGHNINNSQEEHSGHSKLSR